MLVGHLAVGFISKRIEPRLSLGTCLLAPLLADLLLFVFVILAARTSLTFLPIRDYQFFVAGVRRIFPRDG